MALEEATTVATQENPRIHKGMSEVPLFISENNLNNCGNSSLKVPGATSFAIPEHHDFTALCKGFKEEINPHPQALVMSLIQPLRLGCEPLEDEINHGTFMINQGTNLEPEDETAATLLEELVALLNMGGEEILPPSQLGPHGTNIAMGERYFLRGLQGAAFQPSMK